MISLESIELNKKDRGPRYRKHLDDHVMWFDKDYPEYEREFIKRFVSTLPCWECQKHAVAYVEKNEPGFVTQDQYLEYKLELHNYVNEKLDKIKRTKKEYINYLVINYS
jgi:hypothetical protein